MKICVLLPDYSTTKVDYQYYDPPRNLSSLLPEHEVDHVFLNKLTTFKQLKQLSKNNYDIYVNLCEGYLDWEVPSIDVIHSLELLNLPYTGPTALLYDPSKELMKYVAFTVGIKTPSFNLVEDYKDVLSADSHLRYPLFVKPSKAGDSLGIDENSLITTKDALTLKLNQLLPEFGSLLVEEYIEGREFTVLVAANPENENSCKSFLPVEYKFPSGRSFKTYSLKTSELHPDCNFPIDDPFLEDELRTASEKIFIGFGGKGYARLDFRVNNNKEVFFLEINFTCSVFYKDGFEGSADFILKYDGICQKGFLEQIIREGMFRHKKNQKPFYVKGNASSGYGIYSKNKLDGGVVIFSGEEKSQKIVTRRFVEKNWKEKDKKTFRQYAYPLSSEVFILWSDNPSDWAPQNHSCNPNTKYDGLNVITTRVINKNEELTLDYAEFLDEYMEPFNCSCGEPCCRKHIIGRKNNSVTARESI